MTLGTCNHCGGQVPVPQPPERVTVLSRVAWLFASTILMLCGIVLFWTGVWIFKSYLIRKLVKTEADAVRCVLDRIPSMQLMPPHEFYGRPMWRDTDVTVSRWNSGSVELFPDNRDGGYLIAIVGNGDAR